MRVLGVDGCRAGWIVAVVDRASPAPREVTWVLARDAAAVVEAARAHGAAAIGIDIPIGLPADGPRACDVAARRRLGRAGASVFPAPVRAVLAASTYAAACAASRAVTDPPRALSLQAWHLVGKIGDVDAVVDRAPCPFVEIHPEVSFRALDPGVQAPKRTAAGRTERVAALRPVLDVDGALAARPRPGVAIADALDACAVAWSADRFARGVAVELGDGRRDERGRPMRIVC